MTLRIDPMDQLSAVYQVAKAYPGEVPAMAGRLGVAPSTLYGILRGSEALSVERQDAIIHFAQQAGVACWAQPLHAKAHEHGGVFVALPSGAGEADELSTAMFRAVKEFGDLAGEAARDLADKHLTRRELAEIEREGYEAIAAIAAFVELCRARAAG